MINVSNISLPREKCMKCGNESDILMSSHTLVDVIRLGEHKFCQSCFRKENTNLNTSSPYTFKCPCCHIMFYENMQSLKEAIIIGEAVTIKAHVYQLSLTADSSVEDIIRINDTNKGVIQKLESALLLNTVNFISLYLVFVSCCEGNEILTTLTDS